MNSYFIINIWFSIQNLIIFSAMERLKFAIVSFVLKQMFRIVNWRISCLYIILLIFPQRNLLWIKADNLSRFRHKRILCDFRRREFKRKGSDSREGNTCRVWFFTKTSDSSLRFYFLWNFDRTYIIFRPLTTITKCCRSNSIDMV